MDCNQGLLWPWDSLGRNTGVGGHSLLQGIFPTQEWNPGFLHCKQILYCLSYQGSPVFNYGPSMHLPKHRKNEKAKGPCDQDDHNLMMRAEQFCYTSSSNPQLSLLPSLDVYQNLESFTHVTGIYWPCTMGKALNEVLGLQSLQKGRGAGEGGEGGKHGLDLISCRRHV